MTFGSAKGLMTAVAKLDQGGPIGSYALHWMQVSIFGIPSMPIPAGSRYLCWRQRSEPCTERPRICMHLQVVRIENLSSRYTQIPAGPEPPS